jgi:predicted transport protein
VQLIRAQVLQLEFNVKHVKFKRSKDFIMTVLNVMPVIKMLMVFVLLSNAQKERTTVKHVLNNMKWITSLNAKYVKMVFGWITNIKDVAHVMSVRFTKGNLGVVRMVYMTDSVKFGLVTWLILVQNVKLV